MMVSLSATWRQREMRLAVGQVRPDEDHGRAGRGGEDDQPGDVAVDLHRGQIGPEQIADEEPARAAAMENGLTGPVDEQRDADAAPVLPDLAERGEVDLEQHRHDHQPDQRRHRQVDPGDLRRADGVEEAGQELAEGDAGDDAERHPEGELAFEDGHACFLRAVATRRPALRRRSPSSLKTPCCGGRRSSTVSDGRQSLTPRGVTTIGRLIRIGCAIIASRSWSSVSAGSPSPSSA